MALFERAMVVSYRLSIVTVAPTTVRPQSDIDYRMSTLLKSTGGGSLYGGKIWEGSG